MKPDACAPGWVERATGDGSWTLWNTALQEGCHSQSGAWQQATQRYALGCRLDSFSRPGGVCRLLDIGTGLGLNLAAALWALEARATPLEVLSLELDPDVIARGLGLYERAALRSGPWERWHAPVRSALTRALFTPGLRVPLGASGFLELRLGDARNTLEEPESAERVAFDAVFLDPFSPRRAAELWEEDFLRRVARRMAPQAWLATYSASFGVRIALARAGLRVGLGARVGAKREGTLASPAGEPPTLPPRIAKRLARRMALPDVS